MNLSSKKQKAALIAILSNIVLIVAKLIAGFISGSVSIISDAIHSFSDLLTSFMAFFSVKKSSEPADKEHPFGHGKFEELSGFIEGLIISAAGIFIIYEAYKNIVLGFEHEIKTTLGIITISICIILNYLVSRHLFKVGEETDSIALIADANHLRTDVITSIGVLLALVAIHITGLTIIDPIVAIFVALLILKTGYKLCLVTAKNLLDGALPKEQKRMIKNTIQKYIPEFVVEIKNIKTRKSGSKKMVTLTLIVPENMTIKEGHELCDKIEDDIEDSLENTEVTIHLEPCNSSCNKCPKDEC